MIYACCDELRRNALRGSLLNGIDYLEVLDSGAPPGERQRKLFLHFINSPAPPLLASNIRIEGGERIQVHVTAPVTQAVDVLEITVDQPGDFSIYTLRLVTSDVNDAPPAGVDVMTASVQFSFKVECPSDFDCQTQPSCPPSALPELPVDYLAKDYASFRQLMLDRVAALVPERRERNPADLGVALIELLAYVADRLSYQQDATATEAYLNTARRRVSVRRHARLVAYPMHDGCNARTWVQVQVNGDGVVLNRVTASGTPTQLLPAIPGQDVRIDPGSLVHRQALESGVPVFQLMEDAVLWEAHNEMPFYTWGDARCCLTRTATRATLRGHFPNLRVNDVLIFAEVLGPETGDPADADPTHRYPVRLTSVEHTDAAGDDLTDPLTGQTITNIVWADGDALEQPVCISAVTSDNRSIDDVSTAWGNIILADHGWTRADEALGAVPQPSLWQVATHTDRCTPQQPIAIPPRFRPRPSERPVSVISPFVAVAPARQSTVTNPGKAVPAVELKDDGGNLWQPRRDLLESDPFDRGFVVEVEADESASLRFGDDDRGKRPNSGTSFTASYRVGNGRAGNIGAETLVHIVTDPLPITRVRNPLPATGGIDPESMEEVRQKAPVAFRTQQRAVTEADYAEVTERRADIQRAAGTFRWTGSWYTAFVTADRKGGAAVDKPFQQTLVNYVERFRTAGYDLEVDGPQFVPLEIVMDVCAQPEYFRADVKAGLLQVLSNGVLPDGRLGLFHPDNFTFGQTVYLSPIYAAAQAVSGVASVRITTFGRWGSSDPQPLHDMKLQLERLEVARLDNDRSFPEHGVLTVNVQGGK